MHKWRGENLGQLTQSNPNLEKLVSQNYPKYILVVVTECITDIKI